MRLAAMARLEQQRRRNKDFNIAARALEILETGA
jgi:hypothetical protein